MIIVIHGPPASGKTTLAKIISEKFGLPHISRDLLSEWMSEVNENKDEKIQRFCSDAGYALMFDLCGELAKGKGSFILEGCMNPSGASLRIKEKIEASGHEVFEIFLNASNEVLVKRYLDRAGMPSRHLAHGEESTRGEELARHLNEVIYKPLRLGRIVFEIDGSQDFDLASAPALAEIQRILND